MGKLTLEILEKTFPLDLSTPRICHKCGEDVECGLVNTSNHYMVCKNNAPNDSIEGYYKEKEREEWREADQKRFDAIKHKLTQQESKEYFHRYFMLNSSQIINGWVSPYSYKRYWDYKKELYKKYE